MEPLRNLNYNALDVSATAWFDDFQKFSFGVRDLDLLLCNVIEGAYESTGGVLAQLELTEVGCPIQGLAGHMHRWCMQLSGM